MAQTNITNRSGEIDPRYLKVLRDKVSRSTAVNYSNIEDFQVPNPDPRFVEIWSDPKKVYKKKQKYPSAEVVSAKMGETVYGLPPDFIDKTNNRCVRYLLNGNGGLVLMRILREDYEAKNAMQVLKAVHNHQADIEAYNDQPFAVVPKTSNDILIERKRFGEKSRLTPELMAAMQENRLELAREAELERQRKLRPEEPPEKTIEQMLRSGVISQDDLRSFLQKVEQVDQKIEDSYENPKVVKSDDISASDEMQAAHEELVKQSEATARRAGKKLDENGNIVNL